MNAVEIEEAISALAEQPFEPEGDAHELIPNQNGGPIKWWNITPARFPDQHQGGIHGFGSAFNKLIQLIGTP